jgi:hypothetical protein
MPHPRLPRAEIEGLALEAKPRGPVGVAAALQCSGLALRKREAWL